MRIEDELKTDKFQSEIHKAHLNILYTACIIRNRVNASLRPFDISSEQLNVLRIVRGQADQGIRVKDINARMLERNSNTTRIIDRLIKKDLLTRHKKEDGDARERTIFITREGLNMLSEVDKHWKENNPHRGQLSAEQGQLLNQLLDSIREY